MKDTEVTQGQSVGQVHCCYEDASTYSPYVVRDFAEDQAIFCLLSQVYFPSVGEICEIIILGDNGLVLGFIILHLLIALVLLRHVIGFI